MFGIEGIFLQSVKPKVSYVTEDYCLSDSDNAVDVGDGRVLLVYVFASDVVLFDVV